MKRIGMFCLLAALFSAAPLSAEIATGLYYDLGSSGQIVPHVAWYDVEQKVISIGPSVRPGIRKIVPPAPNGNSDYFALASSEVGTIDPSTGAFRRLAAIPPFPVPLGVPGGMALDRCRNTLMISDFSHGSLLRFNLPNDWNPNYGWSGPMSLFGKALIVSDPYTNIMYSMFLKGARLDQVDQVIMMQPRNNDGRYCSFSGPWNEDLPLAGMNLQRTIKLEGPLSLAQLLNGPRGLLLTMGPYRNAYGAVIRKYYWIDIDSGLKTASVQQISGWTIRRQ